MEKKIITRTYTVTEEAVRLEADGKFVIISFNSGGAERLDTKGAKLLVEALEEWIKEQE